MFNRRSWNLGVLGLMLGLPPASLLAREDGPKKPFKISLFDGKTLEGWKRVETFKGGEVKVDDGAIVLGSGGPITAITWTKGDLPKTDYELIFEAKRTEGSDFFAAATFPVGPSFVTLVNGGWGGSVTGISSIGGADASENDSRKFVKYENGTWYKFRVHVTDDVIRCWVDDAETFAVNFDGQQVKTRIETRPCQPLGFASYRSTGQVRGIQIRSLEPEEIKADHLAGDH